MGVAVIQLRNMDALLKVVNAINGIPLASREPDMHWRDRINGADKSTVQNASDNVIIR